MKTSELVQRVKDVLNRTLTASNQFVYPEIKLVLEGDAKTYKYILLTALAAKAADESLNPLCLQTISSLNGAYDARTVCHNAILNFEREHLDKALGGSNEPFLNKPARYPELAKTNPARGTTQEMLFLLCDFLPTITTKEKAFDCLCYAVQLLLEHKEKSAAIRDFTIVNNDAKSSVTLLRLINALLEDNRKGESLTLIVAGVDYLYMRSISNNFRVEVHPVNQCGASSKEISDLDIYKDGKLYIANELKDKNFGLMDVEHAVSKVKSSGHSTMFFIYGKGVSFDEDEINAYVDRLEQSDFTLIVINAELWAKMIISLIPKVDLNKFVRFMIDSAHKNKFSEQICIDIRNIVSKLAIIA
jgi:hypothetical protein